MLPEPVIPQLRRQYGVVAGYQLSETLSPADRRRVARHPDMERLSPRVWRHAAARRCREQDLLAAVLDTGPIGRKGGLWGKSASSFWGFGRYRSRRPHVAVPRSGVRGRRLGEVHELRHLDASAFTTRLDVPVARPEDTVLWIAGMETHRWGQGGLDIAAERTARTIDHAWRMGLIDGPRVHRLCERSGGRGRSGIVVLRQVLEERPPDYRPSGSALEDRFESVLPGELRRRLERQVAVGGLDTPIGTVDYRHRERPLVVEINGEVFHSSLTDRTADHERYAALVKAGFAVMVVWEYDVFHQPGRIVDALRAFEAAPFEPRVIRPTSPPWESW